MTCPVSDRRGETWEEASPETYGFTPFQHAAQVERFIVVGPPQCLRNEDPVKPGSWWHPVLWIDELGPPAETDPEENGMNEDHFTNGRYLRLG